MSAAGLSEILINAAPGETRLALVEDGRLIEYVTSRADARSQVGALYLGRVASVSRPLDAAFIDLGFERTGLLAFADTKEGAPKLTEGAAVAVRVLRDASADKGPKLTARLEYAVPSDAKAPLLLRAAPDPIDDFLAARVQPGWRVIADHPRADAELHRARTSIFAEHDIEGQIEAALQPIVALPDGASLVIEETAALVAIDVNTGPRGDAYTVNLAAAAEIARQLRLRNLAGQIVIDFVAMKRRDRREQVIAALRAAVADDARDVHVLGLTRLGLAELTRRRVGESLTARLGFTNKVERSADRAALDLLRAIDAQARSSGTRQFTPILSIQIETMLKTNFKSVLDDLTRRHALQLDLRVDPALARGEYRL
jgi:Ribonuclease G/E